MTEFSIENDPYLGNAIDPAKKINYMDIIDPAFIAIGSGAGNAVNRAAGGFSKNLFIGRLSGRDTTSSSNVMIGHGAGFLNTTGSNNAFIGNESGLLNTTGSENVFVGNNAGESNSTGYSNTFIGKSAGKSNSTGGHNIYIGNGAAETNTTGNESVIISNTAKFTTASDNTVVGCGACTNGTTGHSNVIIGHGSAFALTEGMLNTIVGESAGYVLTTGGGNTFLGNLSGPSVTTGINNVCIGLAADTIANASGSVALGPGASATASDTFFLPAAIATNTAAASVNCSFAANGRIHADSSTKRIKANIKDISENIDTSKLYDLRPITYNPKVGYGNPSELRIGFIAEEVIEHFPEIVPLDINGEPFSVRYQEVVVLLLEEMKKLKAEVDDLKSKMQ